jgi:hypothetical protein
LRNFREDRADAGEILLDHRVGEDPAALVLAEGSPTRVVPPPISAIGRWPVCCSQCSIMIGNSEPMCSEAGGAVESRYRP